MLLALPSLPSTLFTDKIYMLEAAEWFTFYSTKKGGRREATCFAFLVVSVVVRNRFTSPAILVQYNAFDQPARESMLAVLEEDSS
jgi:hypothetical protein